MFDYLTQQKNVEKQRILFWKVSFLSPQMPHLLRFCPVQFVLAKATQM